MKNNAWEASMVRGLIVTLVFMCIAGLAFWMGTEPETSDESYEGFVDQFVDNLPKDPGSMLVEEIHDGDTLSQNFSLIGEANGAWFFEGTIPVEVQTSDGTLVWQGIAIETEGGKMTDSVAFLAEIDVGDYVGRADIVVRRNNVSDDPTYDKEYRIRVIITDDADTPVPGE